MIRYALLALAVYVAAASNAWAGCPVPDGLQGKTAAENCKAKGYKDQYGKPANISVCKRLAIQNKDAETHFLTLYESKGCSLEKGCSSFACELVYKQSGYPYPKD